MNVSARSPIARAILVGGAAVAVLDGLDAIVAYKLVLGFEPIPIYQFVASGLVGPSAFAGGLASAALGLAVHVLVAFSAAAAFTVASLWWPALRRHAGAAGAAHGIAVYAFMNAVVIPLSRIPPAPFSLPLFVNGVVGHALFVGLPVAYAARAFLGGAGERRPERAPLDDARRARSTA